jgi:hypothetical protein
MRTLPACPPPSSIDSWPLVLVVEGRAAPRSAATSWWCARPGGSPTIRRRPGPRKRCFAPEDPPPKPLMSVGRSRSVSAGTAFTSPPGAGGRATGPISTATPCDRRVADGRRCLQVSACAPRRRSRARNGSRPWASRGFRRSRRQAPDVLTRAAAKAARSLSGAELPDFRNGSRTRPLLRRRKSGPQPDLVVRRNPLRSPVAHAGIATHRASGAARNRLEWPATARPGARRLCPGCAPFR